VELLKVQRGYARAASRRIHHQALGLEHAQRVTDRNEADVELLGEPAQRQALPGRERCVTDLGFVGTMIMGRTDGEFLSAERFDPILHTAARLGVPIYLHPALPTRVTSADNYEAGLDPIVAARFATAAWGWHNETGIHFLHRTCASASTSSVPSG
jgi:Amidohydrolase